LEKGKKENGQAFQISGNFIVIQSYHSITMTILNEELEKALTKLQNVEIKLKSLELQSAKSVTSPWERLKALEEEVDTLDLTRDLTRWHENDHGESPTLLEDAIRCVSLGKILLQHDRCPMLQYVFQNEYKPLHNFVRPQLVKIVRKSLRNIKYPSQEASTAIDSEIERFLENEMSIKAVLVALTRVQNVNDNLTVHIQNEENMPFKLDSIIELCRPIIDRVVYHFLQESEGRISSNRIERLPEWLISFLRENALNGAPWTLVQEIACTTQQDSFIFHYLDEISQLAKYIIMQRNFFRHEKVVGPKSNPFFLSAGIEQVIKFDAYVRDLVLLETYPVSLSQLLIADDEELWNWFVAGERRWAFSTLFDTTIETESLPHRISPRAEIFSALIHSIQSKAALFSSAASYIAEVGVPLCQNFLDAIHESSTKLRGKLGQRKLLRTDELMHNLESWIELINGTHLATFQLNEGAAFLDHDMTRVGQSMERLRDALVDECSTTLVETVIMERAKLASYLMRCPYLLSVDTDPEVSNDLSYDLQETASIYSMVLLMCSETDSSKSFGNDLFSSHASLAIQSNVTQKLSEKFLEVAFDDHDLISQVTLTGAQRFHTDMTCLFESEVLPPITMRLLDVTKFMTMDTKTFLDLKLAITALIHPTDEHLSVEAFGQDGTALDEAVSMIKAKGYDWIYLEDALSIFNRRDVH
jgi:hypothetical protein